MQGGYDHKNVLATPVPCPVFSLLFVTGRPSDMSDISGACGQVRYRDSVLVLALLACFTAGHRDSCGSALFSSVNIAWNSKQREHRITTRKLLHAMTSKK